MKINRTNHQHSQDSFQILNDFCCKYNRISHLVQCYQLQQCMEFVLIRKLVITLVNITERWCSLDRFLMVGIFLCFVFVPTSFFLSGWASNRFIKMEKKIFKRQQTHLWGSKHNYHFSVFSQSENISSLLLCIPKSFCDDNTF